jgi:hypothetical protein
MLATSSVYFACISSFKDPYEGWLPRSYIDAMVKLNRTYLDQMRQTQNAMVALRPSINRAQLDNVGLDAERGLCTSQLLRETNAKFGASCWHINDGESEAMWQIYGAVGGGIAIESTRERLEAALKGTAPHVVHIDPVRYMNFDDDPIDKVGHRHLMGFIKRKSFEHEREMRAVVMLPEPGQGAAVPCDMNTLIAQIRIAPLADPYYTDAVRYVIDRAGTKLEAPMVVSRLMNKPDY